MKNDDDDENRQNDRRTLLDFRRACRTHAPSLKHLEKKKTKKPRKKLSRTRSPLFTVRKSINFTEFYPPRVLITTTITTTVSKRHVVRL